MESARDKKTNLIEKELQDMMAQLSSENAALTKILNVVSPEKSTKDKTAKPDGHKKPDNKKTK
jgi:hypothetical protein